jgi:hypothetical protein
MHIAIAFNAYYGRVFIAFKITHPHSPSGGKNFYTRGDCLDLMLFFKELGVWKVRLVAKLGYD